MPRLNITHLVRLLSGSVQDANGCLIWLRHTDRHNYGRFKMDGVDWLAHRAAYHLMKGPIPRGFTIDHLCRNTRCINPDHLEAVTVSENLRRVPLRTSCKNGHPFTEENTYQYRGGRNCRTCNRIAQEKSRMRGRT